MAAVRSWFERGRPALFAALQQVCDQIDRDLVAAKDGEAETIISHEQPAALASEHTPTNAASPEPPESPAAQPNGSANSAATALSASLEPDLSPEFNDIAALKAECSTLRRKFNALSANFKIAKEAIQKRRDERDKWIRHASYLEETIVSAEEKHGIRILDARNLSTRAANHATAKVSIAAPEQDASYVASNKGPEDAQGGFPPLPATNISANAQQTTTLHVQSDSTQGEADEGTDEQLPPLPAEEPKVHVPLKREPSSDTPAVVTERVLQKRKRDGSGPDVTELRAKAEPADDSSPILFAQRCALSTQESIDLGDIELRITTPRKRKEWEQSGPGAPKLKTSFATPPAVSARLDQLPQSAVFAHRASVLTPLSVNVQKTRSGGRKLDVPPLKRGLGYAISVLAEDGGFYRSNASVTSNRDPASTAASVENRLEVLLNSPSPAADEEVLARSTNMRREGPVASETLLPIPERRALPFERSIGLAGKPSRVQDGSTPQPNLSSLPRGSVREQSPLRKKNKEASASSLRSKPLSELQLDDFKINALANQGHDFPFTEVVRDQAERTCLPGCSDMHCCGKQFRALALSQRPNPPLTAAQRMEEQKLLEEYLGDYAYKLAVMSREEKAELWVEAKTVELANKYGKHRHRFSRMRSPPGFWNADFPSTQELEADRVEAAKREKQAITERYREAMRPGGIWMFKDE